MRVIARSAYALRVGALMVARPLEALERISGRAELAAEQRRSYGLETLRADPEWERRLHEVLGEPWPCVEIAAFHERWEQLSRRLHGELPLGLGHDADPALARALWCIVRHARPERAVETGVARGVVTSFMLQALEANGAGHLWSIDLPPVKPQWHLEAGAAVAAELRPRWRLLRGSSRRRLPSLLAELEHIDLFVHDSLHTERTMRFEFESAWPALRSRGILVSDDADVNTAFETFFADKPVDVLVAQEELKPGKFAIAVKTSSSFDPSYPASPR